MIGFHLENIRIVAADRDLELESYWPPAVVGDVKIFMHAAIDPPADGESERTRGDGAAFGCNGSVRQGDPRRVVGDGAAVEQLPRLAVRVDGPAADHARIEKVQTFVTGPVNLAIQVGDQDRLTVMNGNLRRTNLDFECHGVLPLSNRIHR